MFTPKKGANWKDDTCIICRSYKMSQKENDIEALKKKKKS